MASACVRTCNSLKSLNIVYPLSLRVCNSSVISVRWRKPRWIPKTQSKLFYVRKPTPRDEEENKMLMQKYANYRTQMKAIRSYFTKFVQEEKQARKEYDKSVGIEQELAEVRLSIEVNAQWNQESANIREARELAEAQKSAKIKAIKDQKQKEKDEEQIAELQSRIDNNIKFSEKFITQENMDEEIEKVLDSRKDFNFPINRKGQRLTRGKTKLKEDISSEPDA
ncbi:hypothetical protein LOTGIDRAFT_232861 [Lottia gigantea]|uniref:Small ribosomal subunit protein mS26 n=1 Tax=Lottia gigantea TaxID=225164 RepID=V4A8Q7_LOTGI|nr:hypothetical protein LOTGIDRAFT_232861 [Lottia gigantea]ESO93137.1 hypothetical protein LOTGIDRAFT_232861 [Lottia gigantea]